MEYSNILKEYAPAWSEQQVAERVAAIKEAAHRNENAEVYKFCLSAVDLTTLTCNDSVASVTDFAKRTVTFAQQYPGIPNVASICVYPSFVETVGLAIDGTPMRITSVGGGFPASQTFLEVKMLEVAMAVENGADEVDIVLNVGKMLQGEYDEAAAEVEVIRSEMDADVVLKVIIESGALKTPDLIRKASLLSMAAGADFVKTSTGKIDVAATPEAAVVMCQAIKDFYENEELIAITKELADKLRKNRTIDWQKRDSARAKMRMMIRKLLKDHRYPPEGREDAVNVVMQQCELWADNADW
jgi:deoxyribose-phosphate aldolase